MGSKIDLDQVSREVPTFDFTPPPRGAALPSAVAQFQQVATQYVQKAERQQTLAAVYESQLHLLHKFMEYRRRVSKRERNRAGTEEYPSLWGVFEAAYERLLTLQLSITPLFKLQADDVDTSMLDAPPGLYIGEETE